MEIVINTNYEGAGPKVLVDDLSSRLEEYHSVTRNDWDNYEKYDVALFMSADPDVLAAKDQNPSIVTGVMDAKIIEAEIEHLIKADFLVAVSIEQEDKALKYNDEIIRYHIFPDHDYGDGRNHSQRDTIRIGYHGNQVHLKHFDPPITDALEEIGEKHEIELWAIYNVEQHGEWEYGVPENVPVKHIQWSPSVYREHLSKVDIGIKNDLVQVPERRASVFTHRTPLDIARNLNNYVLDNELFQLLIHRQPFFELQHFDKHDHITRYKYPTNPGRFYPFAQVNVPVVADFTPSNAQVIRHGKSGYLARSKETWVKYLGKLIKSPSTRRRLAQNLTERIETEFSIDECFEEFNDYLLEKRAEK